MKSLRLVRGTVASLGLVLGCVVCGFAQTNLELLTTLPGNFGPLAISGNYLFVAGSGYPPAPALRIFEISDPAHPVDLGYQDGGGALSGVCVSGSYAYVSCSYFGGGYDLSTRILDISNPTNPVVGGHMDGPWQNGSVDGPFAYMVGSVLQVFDVSHPETPVAFGQSGLPWGYSGSIVARNGYVYLIHFYGLSVYDASDPTNPRHVGGPVVAGALGTFGLGLSGNNACVTDYTNGLWIADVSCPTNPVIVYHRFWSYPVMPDLRGVVTSGNYAYVGLGWGGGGNPGGVWAFDISDPTNAIVVATNSSFDAAHGSSLAISKQHLFASDGYRLSVYSVGSSSPPSLTIQATTTNTLLLSWPTPTPAFAVQQSSDLRTTNWVTFPTTAVVVTGRNQVTIPKPSASRFYRLVSQ